MDLSALGLPMEQLRDVWLIAFMVYLGLCLLVDIAYPVPIKKEKAADLYLEVSGSPVDEALRSTAERTAMGAPLSFSRKGSATKKAKKKLDSIEGAGLFSGWFHVVMYLWGWIVAVSIFTLYWDIVYDGILLPALILPFLMVYVGARWGRRGWREARGYSKDDRVLGMPRIYSATLGKLSAPFRVHGTVPGVEPIRNDRTAYWVLNGIAFLLASVFLMSLAGWSIDEDLEAIYIGHASWFLAVAYIPLILVLLMYNRDYVVYNPDSFQAGRLFLPAKSRPYSEVRAFRVYPKNPDAIKLNPKDASQWRLEILLPSGRKHDYALNDHQIDCLVAQIAFKIEQERWAQLDSPADREMLAKYFVDGRVICTTMGYKPAGKHAEEAARRASFQKAQYK